MSDQLNDDAAVAVPWWQPVLFAALAGGMGWGIRGQYGHETGAMIAGLLVSLVLVFLLCPKMASLPVARAVALGTIAMGFGGSMTYGQTVGLTHDGALIGNWAALRWGMLGLAIKGGLWIGFAGVFLGMGLGGIRYRYRELLLLMLALVGVYFLGVHLLNTPFDPANKVLPTLYFSDHWHWEPDKIDMKPRFECWGGLLVALAATVAYAGFWRKDRLARNMALWGIIGGALGFPLGQSLQAFHAWNPEVFQEGLLARFCSHWNWWNMMETTFGAVMGATLGFGLWLNRRKIRPAADTGSPQLPDGLGWFLLTVHAALLIAVTFLPIRPVDALYDLGLMMGIIPIVAVAGGRWWPYLVVFPVTLLPIAGKTIQNIVFQKEVTDPQLGTYIYLVVPLVLATALAIWFAEKAATGQSGRYFTRRALLFCTWTYFLLNYAFFDFPWPWATWTGRTPNGIIFTICAIGLTVLALTVHRKEPDNSPVPAGGNDTMTSS